MSPCRDGQHQFSLGVKSGCWKLRVRSGDLGNTLAETEVSERRLHFRVLALQDVGKMVLTDPS
jgi:hypothetical protein